MKYFFYILCILNLYIFPIGASYGVDLVEVYNVAIKNDPELLSAEAKHKATIQEYPIARSYLLPNLNFSASSKRTRESIDGAIYGRSSSTSQFTTDEFSINLKQPLYRRDLFALLEKSEFEVAKSLAERDSARQDLIIRVAEAYFNILDSIDNITYVSSEKAAIKSQLDEAKKRFEVGLIAITDYTEARASYDLSETQYIEAENLSDLTKESLYVLTGQQFKNFSLLSLDIKVKNPDPDNIKSWEDFAIKQNLDLLAYKRAQDVAIANLKYERSKHFPTIDIYGTIKETDKGGGTSGAFDSNNDFIGIELNIPIFSGGNTYYSSKQASYLEEKTRYELLKKKREVIRDTRQAFLNLKSSISKVKYSKKALESNELSVEYNKAGFEVGTRSTTDVLLALKDSFKAKKNYSKAKYEYLISKLKLKKSIGTLSIKDIKIINTWLN
ncbi:TolC family outer membrane protein [Gammaproteobacteria bacterium]|nr:TolC family outer membrane protein [Gammaproteobacteria bacterium]MDC3385925.1 TolC family outer membrane protein [Gammaproteobacteria bacterium]